MPDTSRIHKALSPVAMVKAFAREVRAKGFNAAATKAVRYAKNLRRTARILEAPSIEDRFTNIYQENYWGDEESVSGFGSTLQYTENLRRELPLLIDRFAIRSIFDAPCGDFNWMQRVLHDRPVDYTGADIVRPLIATLNERFGSSLVRFRHLNLTQDAFPPADLWVCRDCLFHLSEKDIFAALSRFVASDIPFILTTTHRNAGEFKNVDISTGDFRFLDLFAAPYQFPTDALYRIVDYRDPEHPREMCLWSHTQIERALARSADPSSA